MVRAMSTFRFESGQDCLPEHTLGAVNDVLSDKPQFGMFCTLCYLVFDLERQEMCIANAGHLPPLLIDHKQKSVTRIEGGKSSPLGIMPGITYEAVTIPLRPGMDVWLYSDGIIEARNQSKEEYGFDRIEKTIAKHFGHPAIETEVLKDIERFVGDAPQHDDMTLVVVHAK